MKTAPIEIITPQHQHAAYVMKDGAVSLTVYPRVDMFTFDLSLIAGILRHGSMGYSLKNMPIEIVVRKSESSEDSVVSKCYEWGQHWGGLVRKLHD